MRDWLKQAEVDAGERDGLTSSEREELAALPEPRASMPCSSGKAPDAAAVASPG